MLENYNYQIVLTALEFLSAKGIVITGGGAPICPSVTHKIVKWAFIFMGMGINVNLLGFLSKIET